MYEYSKPNVQSAVSMESEGINERQLKQMLEVLTDFRNVCAHADEQNAKLSVTDLLEMMGMPANWSKITTYKKV